MATDSKPITLDDFKQAIEELPDDTLVSVKSQLEVSISKLKETNSELQHEIEKNPESKDDIELYKGIIVENEQVAANQKGRIELIVKTLKDRGLGPKESKKEVDATENKDDGVYL